MLSKLPMNVWGGKEVYHTKELTHKLCLLIFSIEFEQVEYVKKLCECRLFKKDIFEDKLIWTVLRAIIRIQHCYRELYIHVDR